VRLLTLREAARLLNVSPRTIQRRVRTGQLSVFRDGRIVRIPEAALLRYIDRRTVPAAEPRPAPRQAPAPAQAPLPRTGRRVPRLWEG
jgi:excisionase family DNA binding protein